MSNLTAEQIAAVKAILPESVHSEIGDDATLDTVKEITSKVYIDKDLAEKEKKSEIGKALGSFETKFKRIVGDAGKGKNAAELATMVEELYTAKLTELEEAKSGKGGGDVEALKAEVAEAKKAKSEFEKMLQQANAEKAELMQKVEAAENEKLTAIEQFKLNQAVTTEWDSVSWIDGTLPYTKKGLWDAEVEGKYTFKIENGKKLVYDTEGNIVRNGTSQMEARELFAQLAEKVGLLKKNGATSGGGSEAPVGKELYKTKAQKEHYAEMMRIVGNK